MISLSAFDLVPSKAKGHEWLLSNGLGGYSSSTAIGMNTRKYHGLLIAPLKGIHNRHIFLSKLEETAKVGSTEFSISTNAYEGVVFPTGFKHQTGFSFSRHPTFTYSLNGAKLEKSVRMLHRKNAVVVSYRLKYGKEAKLSIRPLIAPRPIHSDPISAALSFNADKTGFSIGKPAQMRVCCSFGNFTKSPDKYYRMQYIEEKERGYPFSETLFSPGYFSATLCRGDELHVVCSLELLAPSQALEMLDRQEFRQNHLAQTYSRLNGISRTDFSDMLLQAADSFMNITKKHKGITAGFHWFSEWSRDSMISLPGLLLSTGQPALAREILGSHAKSMRDGLIPNFVDEANQPHYTSSDACLWFVNAVREYAETTQDFDFIKKKLWKSMKQFLFSYKEGNALVSMDSDCLLKVKEPASTWMDAKINAKAVTPRKGKPVEINALWQSNLHFIGKTAQRFNDKKTGALAFETAEQAAQSFQNFLSADKGQLFDVLEPNDPSMRPNQIFAVSLPNSPLNQLQKKHVFNLVRTELYTPLGLRTLSPKDERFHETYSGNQEQRDAAYHQGAVWPWLLGAFYDAQLAVYPGTERQILSSLRPFSQAMASGCAGSLPEIYEPKSMAPKGAISQAWSIAEVLRIYTKVKKAAAQPMSQAPWIRQIAPTKA